MVKVIKTVGDGVVVPKNLTPEPVVTNQMYFFAKSTIYKIYLLEAMFKRI